MNNKKLNNRQELKDFRKQLRNKLTPAEARMWTYLKGKQLDGRKFRRQHSFGGFILDFYCPQERLAIELDGDVHFSEVAADRDIFRDMMLAEHGILVLRFVNNSVFDYPEYVLDKIKSKFGWWDN